MTKTELFPMTTQDRSKMVTELLTKESEYDDLDEQREGLKVSTKEIGQEMTKTRRRIVNLVHALKGG